MDDDAPNPLADEPIDLSKNLQPIHVFEKPSENITKEFNNILKVDDEADEDFALLAAENLAKTPTVAAVSVPSVIPTTPQVVEETNWAAFQEEKAVPHEDESFDKDPFDTTFAENIVPGKAELKIIEKEILKQENDFDFDPRATDTFAQIKVKINVTDPAGERESISSIDRILGEKS